MKTAKELNKAANDVASLLEKTAIAAERLLHDYMEADRALGAQLLDAVKDANTDRVNALLCERRTYTESMCALRRVQREAKNRAFEVRDNAR